MKFHISILLSLVTLCLAHPIQQENLKVIKYPTEIHNTDKQLVSRLKKRDGSIIALETDIHQILLTFPLNIGGHLIESVVDTGSRSSWIYNGQINPSSPLCSSQSCFTSTDNIDVTDSDYAIYYRGDFGAFGKWATGKLSVGGSKEVDFKFGLADRLDGSTGGFSWAGFGYDSNEFTSDSVTHLIDALHDGGVIANRIFQIDYNELTGLDSDIMGHGTLTLGGYNAAVKFFDMTTNIQYYLAIPMNSVSNSNGKNIALGDAKTVVFDSGSTSLLLKQKYIDAIFKDVEFDEEYKNFFKCSDYSDFKITFEIDGSSSLSIPLTDLSWNNYKDSDDLCQLMIGVLPDDVNFEIAFGQYAMKNLINVFDIENRKLGLASNNDNVIFS